MNSINWSEKVKHLDKNIRNEIGIEGESEIRHILIKVLIAFNKIKYINLFFIKNI